MHRHCSVCYVVYLFKPSVSPQQAAVLREGGLERLVAAAAAMEPVLRCNGVWALQNLVHAAPLAVKAALLGALPWPAASTLLSDPEPDIQARVRMQLAPCCCRPSSDARYRRTSLVVGSKSLSSMHRWRRRHVHNTLHKMLEE